LFLQSQPISQASTRLHASSANVHSKRVSPSYTPQQQQNSKQQLNSKDYTSEMFTSFQKNSLKNKPNMLYNSVDNTVTEAR
jgi:hypothetical protein